MTQHALKIKTGWLDRVLAGQKKAEVRLHDRDFQVGDLIRFTEVDNLGNTIDGRPGPRTARAVITHVIDGCHADGIGDLYCVLSIGEVVETTEPESEEAS